MKGIALPAAVRATAVLLLSASFVLASESSYEGKIESVGDDNFVVKVGAEQYRFLVGDKTKITLDGETARLADLKAGHSVTVKATKEDDKLTATSVEAKSS